MSVGMPVWWSTQRRHVLRACCAAWRRIVVTSRTSSEWLVGHAVKEEGGVSGVGLFHLVPYGVPIVVKRYPELHG